MLYRVRRFLDVRPGEGLSVLLSFLYIALVVASFLLAHRGALVSGRVLCERIRVALGIAGTVEATTIGPTVRGVAGWLLKAARPVTTGYWLNTPTNGAAADAMPDDTAPRET